MPEDGERGDRPSAKLGTRTPEGTVEMVWGLGLNERAYRLAGELAASAGDLRVLDHTVGGARVLDCGVDAEGGLSAGIALARVCTSGLAEVTLTAGELDGIGWPQVFVSTDRPVAACLLSQYAGWQIAVEDFFAMGSGPMRAVAGREELFETLGYREDPGQCVGVLESGSPVTEAVVAWIAEHTGVPAEGTILLTASTSSQAGNLQVVARSVETSIHKLFELGFDVSRISSGCGTAPLPPVAADDLAGIGRTNDAILYGGRVMLAVHGDDDSLVEIGHKVPSVFSEAYGKPFLEIFEEAGRDFYQIDPHLFSPAEIVFQNLDSGRVHHFGQVAPHVLRKSFGL